MIFYKTINKKIKKNELGGIFLKNKKTQNRKIQINMKRKKFERKQKPLKLCKSEVTIWT